MEIFSELPNRKCEHDGQGFWKKEKRKRRGGGGQGGDCESEISRASTEFERKKKLSVDSTGKDFEKYDRYITDEKARFRDRKREREGVGFAWDFRIQGLKMNRV